MWRNIPSASLPILFRRACPNHVCFVRSVALSFKYYGDAANESKPSLLIMHGLLGNKKNWSNIGKIIARVTKKVVVVVDLRNHGESPHVNSHKYTEMAADVEELMKAKGIDQIMLLGFSMGGRAAMSLALMKPAIITGIMVIDISPVSSCPDFVLKYPKVLEAMKKVDFSKLKSKKVSEARKYIKRIMLDVVPSEMTMKDVLSNVGIRKSDSKIGWTCNLDIFIKHFKYIVTFPKTLLTKTYLGPTKFIGGQYSEFLPADDLPRILEIFPNATVSYIPKSGHLVHVDDTSTFLEVVVAFVNNPPAQT